MPLYLALAAGGLASMPCFAAETESESTVVMLVSRDQTADSGPFVEAIGAQLSDLDVNLAVQPVADLPSSLHSQIGAAESIAATPEVIAVFWYDLVMEGEVYLFLAGPTGDRILVRKLENTQDRGRAEGLAIIVRSSIMALLFGGQIGISVEEAIEAHSPTVKTPPDSKPDPTPPPAQAVVKPPPTSLRPERVSLGLAYAYHTRSSNHPAVNGLHMDLDVLVTWKLRATLGYTIFKPLEQRGELADLEVAEHPVNLGLKVLFDPGNVYIGATAALVLDIETQKASHLSDGMKGAADTHDVVWGGLLTFDFLVRLAPRLDLTVSAGLRGIFNARQYNAALGERVETLVDCWPVQPWIQLGIRVGLI